MQQIINDVKCWRGFLNASIQSSECSASHCSHSFRNDWILIVTTGSERDLKLILSDQKVKELCENCVLGTACQNCGEPGFVVAISRIEGSSGSIYTSPPSRSHNCDTRRKLNITSHFGPLCRANKMKMRFGCPTRWFFALIFWFHILMTEKCCTFPRVLMNKPFVHEVLIREVGVMNSGLLQRRQGGKTKEKWYEIDKAPRLSMRRVIWILASVFVQLNQ